MNHWTKLSIEYANQRSYLDDLFRVYPTIPEGIREIDNSSWQNVEVAFNRQDNLKLLTALLKLPLFPIKDSYIAYLKRDKTVLERNPKTVDRICGRLYELGLDKLFEQCSQPKETNRQIGPMFKTWLSQKTMGIMPVSLEQFESSSNNAILNASDPGMMHFAKEHLGYEHDKGLDFLARFNGQYIIGEAKFLTDFGGHQNAQFNDAMSTIGSECNAIKIAVLDGVLFIEGNNKMYSNIVNGDSSRNIMSALVLREFLYQI